jgi:carbonic anhydrase
MKTLKHLFENNKNWANRILKADPDFFQKLSKQQSPEYLWIGCSDSRVPANEIVDLMPGELFVHRNIANLVVHTDFNCLSVIEYAVEVLKVKHIIVCGHYNCGGVSAALKNGHQALVDNWLRNIQEVFKKHESFLNALPSENLVLKKLCELNIIEQVMNVCQTTIVQKAWQNGLPINIHGWIYGINDGLLNDLGITISQNSEVNSTYKDVLKMVKTLK